MKKLTYFCVMILIVSLFGCNRPITFHQIEKSIKLCKNNDGLSLIITPCVGLHQTHNKFIIKCNNGVTFNSNLEEN
jgi:hypothetical protein